MLAPLAGAVAAEGVGEVQGAGRPVRFLELTHAVGHVLEEVGRDGQVIDAQVQLAHRFINRFGSDFRRNHVLEGEIEAGVAGAGRAVGEGNWPLTTWTRASRSLSGRGRRAWLSSPLRNGAWLRR